MNAADIGSLVFTSKQIQRHLIYFSGYTIPLDKRLAADGRGLQQQHINENFSKLAEALYLADRKAREAVEARAQLERKMAAKEKEKKEEHLRAMAQRARDQRAGIRVNEEVSGNTSNCKIHYTGCSDQIGMSFSSLSKVFIRDSWC